MNGYQISRSSTYSEDEAVSNDFFRAVPFETLYYEYRRTRREKIEYENAIRKKLISPEYMNDVKKYMDKIDKRVEAIQ